MIQWAAQTAAAPDSPSDLGELDSAPVMQRVEPPKLDPHAIVPAVGAIDEHIAKRKRPKEKVSGPEKLRKVWTKISERLKVPAIASDSSVTN